jgi:MFS family permease
MHMMSCFEALYKGNSMHNNTAINLSKTLPAILTGWMFFLLCYISRVEPCVIVNELMSTFNMTASTFGFVSSCLYITYVVMQIPVGVLLDKFGSRVIISSGALISAIAIGALVHSIYREKVCVANSRRRDLLHIHFYRIWRRKHNHSIHG